MITCETDIDFVVADPFGQVLFITFDDFKENIRIFFLEFCDDLREPVDGAADVRANL